MTADLRPGDTRAAWDRVADLYLPVAILVLAAVAGALVVVALRSRDRSERHASKRNNMPRLEIAYVAFLTLVAAGLAVRTLTATGASDTVEPASAAEGRAQMTVEVVASQWNWRFDYGGGVVQTGNGREGFARLVVPADRVVRFDLTALDVIHAFWIPATKTKYDAIPGRTNRFLIRFPPGLDYTRARCSEFCGTYHDQMRFLVSVLPAGQFDAWLARRRAEVAR